MTDRKYLGVVFYELFTGEPPFTGSLIRIIDQIANDPVTSPTEVDDALPSELDEILLNPLKNRKE